MQEKSLSRRAGKVFIRSHLTLLQGKTFDQTEPLNCTLEDLSIQLLSMLTAKSRQRQKIENKPSSFNSRLTLPKKMRRICILLRLQCYFLITLDNHICCISQNIKVFWKYLCGISFGTTDARKTEQIFLEVQ